MKKIIVYPALISYRRDIFNILHEEYDYDLIFGNNAPQKGQKTISDHSYLTYNNYVCKRFFFSTNLLHQLLKYDLIILLGFNPLYIDYSLLVLFLKIFYKKKKIYWWGHGTLGNQGFFGKLYRIFFYKLSDGLLSYSKYEFLPDKKWFDFKKVYYIGNSNNFDSIYEGNFKFKKKSVFNIIFIGRLQKRKGIVEFSRLWVEIERNFKSLTGKKICLNIYGDGECKNDIVISESLIIHGHKNPIDIRDKLLSSDIAICPKAVGLVLYHVNWFGLPLITIKNNIDHGPEINDLKDKINGSFFNDFNPKSILKEIIYWHNKINFNSKNVKEICRNEVIDFSPKSVAKKIKTYTFGT